MSIIGKKYKPSDNSYSVAISKENEYHGITDWTHDYLAGSSVGHERKVCTILTEPFQMRAGEKKSRFWFIVVEYNDNCYTTLFYKKNIIEDKPKDMTKVTILGETQGAEPEKKKIEFVKEITGENFDISDTTTLPCYRDNIVFIRKDYGGCGYDLMYAFQNGRADLGCLFLGHFNDGIV